MSQKPFLESVGNSPESTQATLEFVRYLGRNYGGTGALNCLRYYRDLNWLSRTAFTELRDHLQGLSVDELEQDPVIEDPTDIEVVADTEFGVHAESLRYISEIAGDDFAFESAKVEITDTRVTSTQEYFTEEQVEASGAADGSVRDNGRDPEHDASYSDDSDERTDDGVTPDTGGDAVPSDDTAVSVDDLVDNHREDGTPTNDGDDTADNPLDDEDENNSRVTGNLDGRARDSLVDTPFPTTGPFVSPGESVDDTANADDSNNDSQ